MSNEMLDAAAYYQACGMALLQWKPVKKLDPKTGEWTGKWDKKPTHNWAIADQGIMTAQQVQFLWTRNPSYGVGLITGPESDVIILDGDDAKAVKFIRENTPATPWMGVTQQGMHFGFRAPAGIKVKTNSHIGCKEPKTPNYDHARNCLHGGALCNLDIRGTGGFAALPPSIHPSGFQYHWHEDCPESFEEILEGMSVFDPAWLPAKPQVVREERRDIANTSPAIAAHYAAARTWLLAQPGAISGQQGRSHTFYIAAMLVRDYALPPASALELMIGWNNRCEPPWEVWELESKIDDAWDKGSSEVGARIGEMIIGSFMESKREPVPELVTLVPEEEVAVYSNYLPPGPVEPVEIVPTPPAPTPAPSKPKSEIFDPATLSDSDFVAWLALEVHRDRGRPFEPEIMAITARISRTNAAEFARLQHALDKSVSKTQWKNELRVALAASPAKMQFKQVADVDDRRPEVVISQDERKCREAVLDVLAQRDEIYCTTAGKLCYVRDEVMEVADDTMHNLVIDRCTPVTKVTSPEGDVCETKPTTMPASLLNLLRNLMPEHTNKFRVVRQIRRAPFFTPSGQLVCEAGYNEETQTLLHDPISVDPSLFPSSKEAVAYLADIFKEFPWQSPAEFTHYLAAMLSPLIRPAFHGAMPAFCIEANAPNSGKTLLAQLIGVTYGIAVSVRNLPHGEDEIVKTMVGILQQAKLIELFDNVKYNMDSPCLDAIFTCDKEYECRILGSNMNGRWAVRQLWLITANNLSMSIDQARRTIRVRLRREGQSTSIDDRKKHEIESISSFVEENRSKILSALIRMVLDWIDAGCTYPSDLRIMDSFDNYCKMVGGILHNAGMTDWLSTFDEATKAFSMNDNWPEFFGEWWAAFGDKPQMPGNLFRMSQQKGLLVGLTAKLKDEAEKLNKFKKVLSDYRDHNDGTFRVTVVPGARPFDPVMYKMEYLLK